MARRISGDDVLSAISAGSWVTLETIEKRLKPRNEREQMIMLAFIALFELFGDVAKRERARRKTSGKRRVARYEFCRLTPREDDNERGVELPGFSDEEQDIDDIDRSTLDDSEMLDTEPEDLFGLAFFILPRPATPSRQGSGRAA